MAQVGRVGRVPKRIDIDAEFDYKWPVVAGVLDKATRILAGRRHFFKWEDTEGRQYMLRRQTPEEKEKAIEKKKLREELAKAKLASKGACPVHAHLWEPLIWLIGADDEEQRGEEAEQRKCSTESIHIKEDYVIGNPDVGQYFSGQIAKYEESFASQTTLERSHSALDVSLAMGNDIGIVRSKGGGQGGRTDVQAEFKSRRRRRHRRDARRAVLNTPIVEVKHFDLPEDECPEPEWKKLENRFPRLRSAMEKRAVLKEMLKLPGMSLLVDKADNAAWQTVTRVPVLHDYFLDEHDLEEASSCSYCDVKLRSESTTSTHQPGASRQFKGGHIHGHHGSADKSPLLTAARLANYCTMEFGSQMRKMVGRLPTPLATLLPRASKNPEGSTNAVSWFTRPACSSSSSSMNEGYASETASAETSSSDY